MNNIVFKRFWPVLLFLFCAMNLSLAAERIISLAPHTTELAYAAGLGDKLIAVSEYSDYPSEAQQLERVASWQGVNLERILSLKPDLVLAWRGGNPQRVLDQLTQLGINVLYSDPHNIADIADDIRQLGQYIAQPEQAERAAADLLARKIALMQTYGQTGRAPIPVFLQFGNQPLFTASGQTLQSEIIELCGGRNIFADSPMPWPQVSKEQVLSRQPAAIVIAGETEQAQSVRDFWHGLLSVPVISVPEDWLNRSGPRVLLAAERLCQTLANLPSHSSYGS